MTVRGLALTVLLLVPAGAHAAPYTKVTGQAASNRVVIVLHGGSWYLVGAAVTDETATHVRRFGRWGNRVVNADYAAGAAGLRDVLAVYDAERRRAPAGRICLYGESAGGHWALMVAAMRPDVDCVVSAAGPADFLLAKRTDPSGVIAGAAEYAFGTQLLRYSPAAYGPRIRARLLLEFAANDTVVPPMQGALLTHTAPHVGAVILDVGDLGWVHSGVDRTQWRALRSRERRLLAR